MQAISSAVTAVNVSKFIDALWQKIAEVISFLARPFFALLAFFNPLAKVEKSIEELTIIDFYQGGKNDRGVTLEEIWTWDDATLEARHNFIQWLFPIKEKSRFNPTAPTINPKTIEEFTKDSNLQDKMRKSVKVMRAFYGLNSTLKTHWITPQNHNYLRLTRMLTSLKLHGLKDEASLLYSDLERVYKLYPSVIGKKTFEMWGKALEER